MKVTWRYIGLHTVAVILYYLADRFHENADRIEKAIVSLDQQ
jgi:hypothetical protein